MKLEYLERKFQVFIKEGAYGPIEWLGASDGIKYCL